MQHAVDAVTHAQVVGQRFDMDIRGALAQGFADHLIDEFFDRSLLRLVLVEHVDLFAAAEVDVLFHAAPLEQLFESFRTDAINLPQRGKNSLAGVDLVAHVLRHGLGHSLAGEQIERIVGEQRDRLVVRFDR